MSVCWGLVCDDRREKLWCGQNQYLYIGDKEMMRDLSAFLYECRGHDLRIVTDLEWDGSEEYIEVGSLYGQWEVTAVSKDEKKYLGVFDGSRRQAFKAAAEAEFPDVGYDDITNVLCNEFHLVTLTGVPDDLSRA